MKNIKNIVIVVLSLIVVLLIFFVVKLKMDSNIEQKNNTNNDMTENESEQKEYDCSFTQTYRVIDKIDYPLAADGVSYIVVDTYQGYDPFVVAISSSIDNLETYVVDTYQGYDPFVVAISSSIDNLETYKYYEFTYHLKGKGLINNFKQLNSYLIPSLFNKYNGNNSSGTVYVELDIVETSKKGVEQIQEDICK